MKRPYQVRVKQYIQWYFFSLSQNEASHNILWTTVKKGPLLYGHI